MGNNVREPEFYRKYCSTIEILDKHISNTDGIIERINNIYSFHSIDYLNPKKIMPENEKKFHQDVVLNKRVLIGTGEIRYKEKPSAFGYAKLTQAATFIVLDNTVEAIYLQLEKHIKQAVEALLKDECIVFENK